MTYAEGLRQYEALLGDVSTNDLVTATSTEADTRAKVIDRILRQVLNWPEHLIRREHHTDSGYSDYILSHHRPLLVIEAKRYGATFLFPTEKTRRSYALTSLRAESSGVGPAVVQVRAYADDNGIEFACATNGAQWIVFRAITPGAPWSAGTAVVFRGLEDVKANFTDFWNLLSFEAVSTQSLTAAFAAAVKERLTYKRALDDVLYSDVPLQRNGLSPQLQPLIQELFRDLTGAEQEEVLRKCYVVDRKVQGLSREVRELFNDCVPEFAKRAGFQDLDETIERSGALDSDFKRAVDRGDFGTTILILGGIGSGKTTFLHRFFRVTARAFVDRHCAWFYVPFTEAPPEGDSLGTHLRKRVLALLPQWYPSIDTTSAAALRSIYSEPLAALRNGLWSLLDESARLSREVAYLEERLQRPEHCDYVLRHLRTRGVVVTLVIDNVDQRQPPEQVQLFFLAHELSRAFDSIVVVALREESFYKGEQAGAFNAYHNIRYHIASPDLRTLIQKRVEYALDVSRAGEEALRLKLRSGIEFNAKEIRTFMRILHGGCLKKNPLITQFIDAISQGNMRSALEMFAQFMVSGTTNVEKMLKVFRGTGRYDVAEHEFIKAVMLGDFQFYKERRSRVLNLFEASGASPASNLTALRLLDFLATRSGHAHEEGVGFVPSQVLIGAFSEVFGNTEDAEFHLARLIKWRLVESDNRQVDDLLSARFVRVTRSGLYYANTLAHRFQYLDQVSVDTPIWERRALHEVRVRATAQAIPERVARVAWFLSYLRLEDERSSAAV